jgi:hypothetical protein
LFICLCLEDKADVVVVSDEEDHTLQSLLTCHAKKFIDTSASIRLEVDRSSQEKLWLAVVAFYKNCVSKPEKLTKELIIEFTAERGADSGSLRKEFFEDAIKAANMNLLEGEDDRRVLKKEWGSECMYEMMGGLVAHSLLQNGPALSCLSPALYEFLTGQNCYPEIADIPLSLGTHELISMIQKVCACLRCSGAAGMLILYTPIYIHTYTYTTIQISVSAMHMLLDTLRLAFHVSISLVSLLLPTARYC